MHCTDAKPLPPPLFSFSSLSLLSLLSSLSFSLLSSPLLSSPLLSSPLLSSPLLSSPLSLLSPPLPPLPSPSSASQKKNNHILHDYSCPTSPSLTLRGTPTLTPLLRKKRSTLSTPSFDIDNIVIPYSMAASTRCLCVWVCVRGRLGGWACLVCVGGEWVWSEWVRGGMCVHIQMWFCHNLHLFESDPQQLLTWLASLSTSIVG